MGTVYEAEQDHPRRTVALKIVRPGLMSRSLLRRFEHEAHVLGRLRHPGIAQIYDAGTDEAAGAPQPYFAMEFVHGPPLTAFAADRTLDTRRRLELLAKVCDAVEHAHQKGVIHRDLKPGNILVEERDAESMAPQPKILDFGVARAIDADIQATTFQTDVGQLIGTIAYMSPEQLSGDPSLIDTRSDVYALGVIGYELLSGAPPFDVRGKTIPDAVRLIGERDAAPLSSVDRAFRGDAETIIATAMEKDRTRRYQSAAELAADIRRSLRDEPILARPTSAMHRLGKFARRNKTLVGGLAAVFVVLVAGVIGTSIGMVRAANEAQKARSETRKAERMNGYLKGMIAFLDPSLTKGQDVTLKQVLDDASRRLDAEFADEAEIKAELLHTIAEGYEQLGADDAAKVHTKRALDLIVGLGDERHPRLIGAWELYARECFRANDNAAAEQAFRRALELNRQRLAEGDPGVLTNIRDLVHVLRLQGKDSEIGPLLAEAMEVARRLPSVPSEATAESLHSLGDILATQHRIEEAEAAYRQALDMCRQLRRSGVASRDSLALLRDFAMLLDLLQRRSEAEALDREAVGLCQQEYGDEHEQTILSMNGLLARLRAQHKLDEAEPLARSLVTVTRKLYGEESAPTAGALLNLATILRARNDVQPALELFQQAVRLRRAIAPLDESELAKALSGEGAALLDVRRPAEAEAPLRECLVLRERNLPPHHPSVELTRNMLGAVLMEQGRYDDAEPLLVSSWETLRAVPSGGPELHRSCLERLIALYERWKKPDEAQRYQADLQALGKAISERNGGGG